ncbi:MAG: hypothetical protein ACU0BS_05695 [Hasllibacter sp.]
MHPTLPGRLRGAPILLGLLALAFPLGLAAQEAIPLSYEAFEFAVPHVDLETCPESLARDGVFCRATLNLDQVHVFAFSEDAGQPLVAVESFDADLEGALGG